MLNRICTTFMTVSLAISSIIALTAAAQAQLVRYVASNGLNSNECTLAAPCRSLQRGINKTPDGGVLQILNASHYGNAAVITRSITIQATTGIATIGAVKIDAPNATVVLRGLLLNGTAVAPNTPGIHVAAAAAVRILHCQIERFSEGNGAGIFINAITDASVLDSVVRDNGGEGISFLGGGRLRIDNTRVENHTTGIGITVQTVSSSIETTITRVMSSGNGVGIQNIDQIGVGGRMHVVSTTAAKNGTAGFRTTGGQMTIEASVASGNGDGLTVQVGGIARISGSVFVGNNLGLRNIGSTLLSRGNNTVSGNTTESSGTITALAGI